MRKKIGITFIFTVLTFFIFTLSSIITALLVWFFLSLGFHENYLSRFFPVFIPLLSTIFIGAVLSFVLAPKFLQSFKKITEAINSLADGDFSARLNFTHPPEFQKLSVSFNVMATKLSNLEVFRTSFINDFSHEFKTPIVSIKGFAQMLKYDNLPEAERQEYLDIVIDEATRLSGLATNVLNLSNIEHSCQTMSKTEFNVGEQLRKCILLLDSKLSKYDLDVNIEDFNILGEKELLSQVWINILDNALKFTREGGVISVVAFQKNGYAHIIFSDSGEGIEPSKIHRIFDKFYQADSSRSVLGNGLGLTLCKKIIDLHNGEISCNSTPLVGTSFKILLPI